MPRLARLDAPGVLHHIVIRGIERRNIFRDNRDRDNFLERLSGLLPETKTGCYAWALLPNHAHFLLRSGSVGVSALMRRLLTGYAVTFNRRHKRHGQLFQNRYKSFVCQEETYLKELVRYIHLNPLRMRIVSDLNALRKYPYCGHGALIGSHTLDWQDTRYVLSYFGKKLGQARKAYLSYVKSGVEQGRRPELVGGGLIRSLGGWKQIKKTRRGPQSRIKADERILGGSDFVMEVLAEANESLDRQYELKIKGFDLPKLTDKVASMYRIDPAFIFSRNRRKDRVEARSLLCYWANRELGMSLTDLARCFEMSPTGVGYAVERGERIAKEKNYKLIE